MTMTETCAACGCQIVNNRTADGIAVRHGTKQYCAECAAMILPPEELERLSSSASIPVPKKRPPVLITDDDIIVDESRKPESSKSRRTSIPAPSSSRVQRAVPPPAPTPAPLRNAPTSSIKQKPSTRSTSVAPSPTLPPPSRASSRRTATGASISRRDLRPASGRDVKPASASARNPREEREQSGRDNGRGRKKKSDPMGLYIGIGIGIFVLLAAGYFIFAPGGGSKATTAKSKPKDEFVDSDKTPSYEYAQRADDFLKKSDSRNAVIMYGKAAERAEKEGNSSRAKEYNMRSVSAEKASTLR